MFWRSMSFSGFGGMGGAGRLVDDSDEMGSVSGASRRSGGGGGLTFSCGWACGGYCCHCGVWPGWGPCCMYEGGICCLFCC